MKIHVITLGCPKNMVDSEYLMAGLSAENTTYVANPSHADVIIINTCAFILSAREESIETILEVIKFKREGSCRYVFVVGCLPQKYKNELEKELPEIDGFYDQLDFQQLGVQLAKQLNVSHGSEHRRTLLTPVHYAYLKIAEGCNNQCTYCTIPSIKGEYRSKSVPGVVAEAEKLAGQGVREIIVIAQDSTYYGCDLGHGNSLGYLLGELTTIACIKWIRLLYAHPAHLTEDVTQLIQQNPKICKYIDLPIQHISSPVLQRMGRKVSGRQIRKIIEHMRKKIPDLAIRTTLMVGFPGETDDDFRELTDFVMEVRFDRLGVFKYSREEDTVAASHTGQVDEAIKEERLQEIMEIQRVISFEKNRTLIGKKIEVLVDEFDHSENVFIARSQWDSPQIDNRVLISSGVEAGKFYRVNVVDAEDYDLVAKLS